LLGAPPATIASLKGSGQRHRLAVYPSDVLEAGLGPEGLQPTAGRFVVSRDEVRFVPRFPFVPDTTYTLLVGHTALRARRPQTPKTPTTRVIDIYPRVPALPLNALRFYVRFSARMSEGLAAQHVHLERADTGERLDVFAPLDPELWDRARQRLTVLLDPARIKRGLSTHQSAGYPLTQGSVVRLVIDAELRDAGGVPLVASHARLYSVAAPVRERVRLERWRVEVPPAGVRDALTVAFDRALDHGLLGRCLEVRQADGTAVRGITAVPPGEESWSFHPAEPWAGGRYCLAVDPILEDLAGNSIRRVFDRDLTLRYEDPVSAGTRLLYFTLDEADRDRRRLATAWITDE
jgi:hypothetical protein